MSAYTQPHFDSIALLTIDVQRDTLDGQPLEIPGTSRALPAIRTLLESFRAAGRPIVHVVRLYRPDGSNVDLPRRDAIESGSKKWLLPGTAGAELAPELLPAPDARLDPHRLLAGEPQQIGERETVLYKPRWGAFYGTRLEELLRGMGVTTIAVCGCNFPNCPRTTLYEASERDLRIVLVTDAVSGLYERGERELEGIGARLMTAASLAGAIEGSEREGPRAEVSSTAS